MIEGRRVSRREFLRLRSTARGRVLEISCRALFMRCADAALEPGMAADYEPWMGEPPPVLRREPADAILERLGRDLDHAHIVRLLEPGWLPSMAGRERLESALAAFRQRGGVVEDGSTSGHD